MTHGQQEACRDKKVKRTTTHIYNLKSVPLARAWATRAARVLHWRKKSTKL